MNGKQNGDLSTSPLRNGMFPRASTLVDIFTKKTEEWFSCFPEKGDIISTDSLLGKIISLHYRNFYQWTREDKVHDRGCPEIEIARLKKEINGANLERCHLIEEIDIYSALKFGIVQTDDWSDLYINSQTLGEMIGKLSVLCLKRFFLEVRLKRTSSESKDTCLQRIHKIEELIKYVSTCYDRFVSHLIQGKAYMPFGQIKIYGTLNSEIGKKNGDQN